MSLIQGKVIHGLGVGTASPARAPFPRDLGPEGLRRGGREPGQEGLGGGHFQVRPAGSMFQGERAKLRWRTGVGVTCPPHVFLYAQADLGLDL